MCFLGIIVRDVEEFKQQKAEAEKNSKIRRAWREGKERLEELWYEARNSAFMNPMLGWLLPVPEEWRCTVPATKFLNTPALNFGGRCSET